MRAIELYKTQGVDGLGKGIERYFHFHVPLITRYVYGPKALKELRGLNEQFGPDSSVDYVINRCYSLIKPIQVRSEILRLVTIVCNKQPKTILEIGTATGGTLFLFARNAPADCQIISIDLPDGPFGGGYPEWKAHIYKAFALPNQTIQLLRRDSHQQLTLRMIEKSVRHGIDFLFIDGDHTYEGVKKDFEMYSPLVNPGGVIAFHDIVVHPSETGCEVNRFWNEIKQQYQHEEFIDNPHQIGYGIGVLYK
jgi:predicted O-methyltransferase YrrM